MAQKRTKIPKKKIASKKQVTSPKSWRALVIVSACVVVGVITALAFAAEEGPATTHPKGKLAFRYVKEKPHILEKDSRGIFTYKSRSRAVEISENGDMYCTPEDGNTVSKGKLSAAQLDSLVGQLQAPTRGAEREALDTATTRVNDFRAIQVVKGGKKQAVIYKSQSESNEFKKAAAVLEGLCAHAQQTVPNDAVPEWGVEDLTAQGVDGVQKFVRAILPVAHADIVNNDPNVVWDGAAEVIQKQNIDNVRASLGLNKVLRAACIDNAARDWASNLAKRGGGLSHSDLGVLVFKYCNAYETLGENVGFGPDSQGVFNGYMSSPLHKTTIVDPAYNYVGIGAYWNNANRRLYVNQIFARCTTTNCHKYASSSY